MIDYRNDIEGYLELQQEINVCRKYGIDYLARKGQRAEAVKRLHPPRLLLKIAEVINETPSTRTLRFVSRETILPPFQAGQYINLCVDLGGVQTSRPYSISSSPRQTAYYDITIRKIKNGLVSNYLLDRCQPGDLLESSGPAGNFYYNPLFHGKELVYIAGGSGITPFMSMIREVCDLGLDRKIHLFYGSQTVEELIFHAELKERAARHANFCYYPVVENPAASYQGLTGRLNAEIIKQQLNEQGFDTVYLCGPRAMYDNLLPQLQAMGIPQRQIRREMFGGGADIASESSWPQEIDPNTVFTVKVPGRSIPARAGESLLTAFERAGIKIPCNCRSGECSLCRVQLLSGQVFMQPGALMRSSDPKYGYIHSCKAYPLRDLEIRL